jgi:hypothetical protein
VTGNSAAPVLAKDNIRRSARSADWSCQRRLLGHAPMMIEAAPADVQTVKLYRSLSSKMAIGAPRRTIPEPSSSEEPHFVSRALRRARLLER